MPFFTSHLKNNENKNLLQKMAQREIETLKKFKGERKIVQFIDALKAPHGKSHNVFILLLACF